jgi:RimJ/RimL family protein N-acetyltransferase
MKPIGPVTLVGRHVRLEPLAQAHRDRLVAAATEDRATYGLTTVPRDADAAAAYIAEALAMQERGAAVPFATCLGDRVVGSTRFGNVERWAWPPGHPLAPPAGCADAVEIGWTWLAASAQRSAVNTEAKRLMLGHAFEVWGVRRVTLKTDARNARSRAAIERIGGRLDGILRAHMPAADGGVRDSAVYSIVASEWPEVRARLDARLDIASPAP